VSDGDCGQPPVQKSAIPVGRECNKIYTSVNPVKEHRMEVICRTGEAAGSSNCIFYLFCLREGHGSTAIPE
jgi:hypothetical protein